MKGLEKSYGGIFTYFEAYVGKSGSGLEEGR